ncbi:MAG: N-acetyl-gamma-glutamyl-phosphate reductase [Ardenticatenaceae bacterium]|nr:N-acetyl-gamma-glutamyl-phosphate reductase [Ardenticatenaceae bacterium]HBY92465.1 N-acetyl-gamma-glutamyl-phosphate reductase [Chloroflexota bacterium]
MRVSIVGASGYVGGEVLRLLLGHPHLEVAQVTSERLAGRFVHSTHPNLRGATQLKFTSAGELASCDLLFLCLPHGEAAGRIKQFAGLGERVVDCSADFRLLDPMAHQRWYPETPVAAEWRQQFVYGLPEVSREALRDARFISGVGCNATVTTLGLLPLARAGLIERVVSEVKVGSSESGASSSEASHHPERSGAVRSFAPTGHRHQAEIVQATGLDEGQLFFSVTAIEMVRGALATSHVFLRRPLADKDLWKLYREAYGREPFVRLVKDRSSLYRYPEPKILAGTNFADVGWELDEHGGRVVVISAIDNLMKGAAGSALQAANLACGFDETAGLEFLGLHPI